MIAVEDLKKSTGRLNMHINFGKDGHGYVYQSNEYPRFRWGERSFKGKAAEKAGKTFERYYQVDGYRVETIEEAVTKLNVSAIPTDEERALLSRLPTDWVSPKDMREAAHPGDTATSAELIAPLNDKGFLEVKWFPSEAPLRSNEPKWRVRPGVL